MKKYINLVLFLISQLILIEALNLSRFIFGYEIAGTVLIALGGEYILIALQILLGGD